MPLARVIVLAIVQGLTEFLPVSSTAHLYLSRWLLGWTPQALDFDISLHIGTLLALLIYFFPDWIQIAGHAIGIPVGNDDLLRRNPMLLWMLAAGSIPVGIAGLAFRKRAEESWRSPYVMGAMLIGVGAALWIADRFGRNARDLASVNFGDSISIGLWQILALVPGASRSGITITAGLFRDFTRETAARFSFLLAMPAIAAAAAKTICGMKKNHGLAGLLQPAFLVGVAVSAATGCAVIGGFLYYLRRGNLLPFVYYRVIFGIIVLALAIIRRPAG